MVIVKNTEKNIFFSSYFAIECRMVREKENLKIDNDEKTVKIYEKNNFAFQRN